MATLLATTINGALTVGNGTSSDIYMVDTDENTRRQHCNSTRIGFLSTSNTWGSWCGTDGSWYSDQSMRAPIFYDSQNTAYYLDPASTSNLNGLTVGGSSVVTNNGGTWGISITGNSGYASSAGNADTVDSLHASSFTRKDATGQWIKPYYEYSSYLTTESPSTLASQMSGGGGLRVDFMNNGGGGNWNHVITWSGYNFYNMYQLGGFYDGGTGTNLYVRSEANHTGSSWTAWRRLLNTTADPYAANMDQYVRTSDTVQHAYFGVGAYPAAGWRIDINSGNGICRGSWYATGDIIAYYSDERLKDKKGKIENALDKIKQLNGFYYTNNDLAKSFGYTDEKVQVGLSAQEVQSVLPEVVTLAPFDVVVDEDTKVASSKSGEEYLTVSYDKLVPLLIEAIKEQQKQIDELKARLN